jgi:hypothetical protein
VGRPEGKTLLGITRRRWEDNINVHLKEIGWKGVDWIDLVQDRNMCRAVMDSVLNLGSHKFQGVY